VAKGGKRSEKAARKKKRLQPAREKESTINYERSQGGMGADSRGGKKYTARRKRKRDRLHYERGVR